jgi:hypothetical protein
MGLREKMFSRIFYRSILTDFGQRAPLSFKAKKFVPYFQYKIGPYEAGYVLLFRKEPTLGVYKHEIFNKMYEYSGYDIIRYLDFHLAEFADKNEFLRFLSYEVSERLKLPIPARYRLKLQSTQTWLAKKQNIEKTSSQRALRLEIENEIRLALQIKPPETINSTPATPNVPPSLDLNSAVQTLSDKIASRMDQVMSSAEEKFRQLTDSFLTGNIELNNHNNLERLVQLYILIQAIKSPDSAAEDKLFKRNSSTDLASILHLHFRAFKDKKFNTVQVKITECSDRLKINDPKAQKLTKALTEFFY